MEACLSRGRRGLWGSWTPRLPPSSLRPAAPASPRAGASHCEQWVAPSCFLAAPLLIDAPLSLFFMGFVAFLPRCGPPRPALCSSLLWQGLSLAVSPSSLPVALSSAPAPAPWAGEARTCWPVSQGPLPHLQVQTKLPPGTSRRLPACPAPRALWPSVKDSSPERLLCPFGWTRACLAASVTAFGPQVWPPPFLIHGTDEALCFLGSLYGLQRSYMDDVSLHLHGRLGRWIP